MNDRMASTTNAPYSAHTPKLPRVVIELKKNGRLNAIFATDEIKVSVLRIIDAAHNHRDGDPSRVHQLEHNIKFMKKIYPLSPDDPHLA